MVAGKAKRVQSIDLEAVISDESLDILLGEIAADKCLFVQIAGFL